jgi:hypothetical protein
VKSWTLLRRERRELGAELSSDRFVLWVSCLQATFHLSVIAWDLPGAVSWENDGIAPRDFLSGVVDNLRWGHGHRYPLFHNLVCLVCCLPALAWGALTSDTLDASVAARMTSWPVMTAVSVTIRCLHVAMSCALLLGIASLSRRLFGRLAGRAAALFAVTCVSLSYYGRVSNLDGPYLTWVVLAVDQLAAYALHTRRAALRRAAVFAAFAVATKDQAYATFVLAIPWTLLVVPKLGGVRGNPRDLYVAARDGAVTYGLCSGALLNPVGFVTRLRMLTGPNSGHYHEYERSVQGIFSNLQDVVVSLPTYSWPWPLLVAGQVLVLL